MFLFETMLVYCLSSLNNDTWWWIHNNCDCVSNLRLVTPENLAIELIWEDWFLCCRSTTYGVETGSVNRPCFLALGLSGPQIIVLQMQELLSHWCLKVITEPSGQLSLAWVCKNNALVFYATFIRNIACLGTSESDFKLAYKPREFFFQLGTFGLADLFQSFVSAWISSYK